MQGLKLFMGGVLRVSHDQHLIKATVDELWAVEGGCASCLNCASKAAQRTACPHQHACMRRGSTCCGVLVVSHKGHLIEAIVAKLWAIMAAAVHSASAVQSKLYDKQLALTSTLACAGAQPVQGQRAHGKSQIALD